MGTDNFAALVGNTPFLVGDFPAAPALDGLFNQALYERGVRTAPTR